MTHYQILQAASVLGVLGSLKLPVKKAYAIYNLSKKAEDSRAFFVEQEKKLIEEFNGEVSEDGRISFKDTDTFKAFTEKYNELKNLEIEDVEPIEISVESLGDQELTPANLAMLDGVINFVD